MGDCCIVYVDATVLLFVIKLYAIQSVALYLRNGIITVIFLLRCHLFFCAKPLILRLDEAI